MRKLCANQAQIARRTLARGTLEHLGNSDELFMSITIYHPCKCVPLILIVVQTERQARGEIVSLVGWWSMERENSLVT